MSMAELKKLTGQKFHYWVVIGGPTRYERGNGTYWLCRCICGTEREVAGSMLRAKRSKSCGCHRRQVTAAINTRHGHAKGRAAGVRETPTYRTWQNMRSRCTNPKRHDWQDYGGRGITVCQRWLDSFSDFLSDMGMKPVGLTLDRIDNNGHYEKSNCRWATRSQQRVNQRPRTR